MNCLFMNILKNTQRPLAAIAIILVVVISGCSSNGARTGENQASDSLTASRSEHSRDGGESDREGRSEHEQGSEGNHGEEGKESGTEYALNETCDQVRNGARLILAYDVQSNSFNGTVENTTGKTLKRVRVEVHLSNGTELGPTEPIDLAPGKKVAVGLSAEGQSFKWWKAHAETGASEH